MIGMLSPPRAFRVQRLAVSKTPMELRFARTFFSEFTTSRNRRMTSGVPHGDELDRAGAFRWSVVRRRGFMRMKTRLGDGCFVVGRFVGPHSGAGGEAT